MKINLTRIAISFLAIVILISGCGEKAGMISLDSEGYGQTILPNGMKLLVNYDNSTSLSSARILVGGGVLSETAENNGITNLMVNMLLKGDGKMTASEITEQLDFLGASVSVYCFRDYSTISFTSLSENFDDVLTIISQSLLTPAFPEDELAKLKHEVEGSIKAANDDQPQVSSNLFWKTAYGDEGYGLPTLGTEESIAGITIDQIKEHYDKYVGGKNIIFSIATDIGLGQLEGLVDNTVGRIKAEAELIAPPSLALGDSKLGFKSYDRNQSFIFTGVVLDHVPPEEVPYLVLLNNIMGASVGSRLWALRQKEKLAYSVYTQYSTDKFGACFRAAIGTDTSKVQIALNSLDRELTKMVDEGITAEELRDAKVNMKNFLIYKMDIKSSRANNMAYYEYVGYNYRFVFDMIKAADQITVDQVNNFIKSNFIADREFTSIVGKM